MNIYEVLDGGRTRWYAAEEGADALSAHWGVLGTGPDDETDRDPCSISIRRVAEEELIAVYFNHPSDVPQHLAHLVRPVAEPLRVDGKKFGIMAKARAWAEHYALHNATEGTAALPHLLGDTL